LLSQLAVNKKKKRLCVMSWHLQTYVLVDLIRVRLCLC
jgi:hypothetical protein